VPLEIIFETVDYIERGQSDTGFDSDNVLTSVEDVTPSVVDYDRMSDGAMLAWKGIVISTTDSCGTSGAGGPEGADHRARRDGGSGAGNAETV
jgi:hypothetical protein